MTKNKSKRSGTHLSVVSQSTQAAEATRSASGKVVTPEELSSAARDQAELYRSRAGAKGVLVGALVCEQDWDLRPMLLEGGILKVVRFSDPALSLSAERFRKFSARVNRLPDAESVNGIISVGESQGQLWQQRLFYQTTLADSKDWSEASLGIHPVHLGQKLVRRVAQWQRDGVVHGHLCLSNIAIEQLRVVVFDFCFRAYSLSQAYTIAPIAPEVQGGQTVGFVSDIYGLGKILSVILADFLSDSQAALVAAMCSDNPDNRPSLAEIEAELLPTAAAEATAKILTPKTPEPMKLGKLLGQNVPLGTGVKPDGSQDPSASVPDTTLDDDKPDGEVTPKSPAELLDWARGTTAFDAKMVEMIRKVVAEQSETLSQAPAQKPSAPVQATTPSPPQLESSNVNLTSSTQQSAETIKTTVPVPKSGSESNSSSGWGVLAIVVTVLFAIVAYKKGYVNFGQQTAPSSQTRRATPAIPYRSYWESGIQSKMQKVASAAAIDRVEAAEIVVIGDALEGHDRPGVFSDFLRAAFNPLWEAGLSSLDREFALKFALAPLISGQVSSVPEVTERHPGILFAILANLPPSDTQKGGITAVPVSRLGELPAPYGELFRALDSLGIKTLGEKAAQGFAQIAAGKQSPEMFKLFLDEGADEQNARARLVLVLELGDKLYTTLKPFYESLYAALRSSKGILAREVRWLDSSPIKSLKESPKEAVLALLLGQLPKIEFSAEALGDLLKYPGSKIRQQASELLKSKFLKSSQIESLTMLTSDANRFSREQHTLLFKLLTQKTPLTLPNAQTFYALKPDPKSVIALLISRRGGEDFDAISIEGARYLKNLKVRVSFEELQKLVAHREALVRAFAYSRLDPLTPPHRVLLERMAEIEPLDSLRTQVKLKLEDAKLEGAALGLQ